MTIAIAVTPTAPVAKSSFCKFDITGASNNDTAAYNASAYPSEAEIRCYLAFFLAGVEFEGHCRSYVFAVAQDGTHQFNNFMFPAAGSWTVKLCRADNDAVLQTKAVTVS